jgi:hypothetical protein
MVFESTVGDLTLVLKAAGLPSMFDEYCKNATLAERFETDRDSAPWCFVGVRRMGGWPFLVVAQKYSPATAGFSPGVLVVPETRRLFIGAGERLIAYDLDAPRRLWEDTADTGFWHWHQHGEVVLMSAELEFAAWDSYGAKLWSIFVEPPWSYEIRDNQVYLDVMGSVSSFPIKTGKKK